MLRLVPVLASLEQAQAAMVAMGASLVVAFVHTTVAPTGCVAFVLPAPIDRVAVRQVDFAYPLT